MKKKTAIIIITLCLTWALMPSVSRAAVSPHFMAVNDTLLPFDGETMPFVSGGVILVPYTILPMAGVWSVSSGDLEQVRLYRGARQVDFFAGQGVTEDQHGDALDWPSARKVGGKLYVPLHQVCEYFNLDYELIEVGRSVIPNRQIWVVRIISGTALTSFDFVDQYRGDMVSAYYEYYSPPPPGETDSGPPADETLPGYGDITVYLSFRDISAGSAERILYLLDAGAAPGLPACFFVSADDIMENPGLIRKISGSGHAIGIWLESGAYEEYLYVSALLFEAAKVKAVLVSADEAEDAAIETAEAHGLLYWGASQGDNTSESAVTDSIPTVSGERWSLRLDCSEDTASLLTGVLLFLRIYDYAVERVSETVAPVG